MDGYPSVGHQPDPPAKRRLAAIAWPRRTRERDLMSAAEIKDSPHNATAALAALPLVNAVRQPMRTCRVCAAPVRHFEFCWRCSEHRRVAGPADVVAPLAYAVGGTESAAVLSSYKNHPIRAERTRCALIVRAMLSSAVLLHESCFNAVTGAQVTVRTVIPSLSYRPGIHPLASIAESIGLLTVPALIPGRDARCDRLVRSEKFALNSSTTVKDRHVLVLDDVWTTGSNAQSAALALRWAGAAVVSVLVIGRWLSPTNPLTYKFFRSRPGTPYDPHVCPVTGGCCPPDSARRSPYAASERN